MQSYCHHYENCTAWYMPNKRITIVEPSPRVENLMIVAHPDDEVIFGGSSILESDPSRWCVLWCTNDYRRIGMAKRIAGEWAFGGAVMFSHGDSLIRDMPMMDYRLYLDLEKILYSRKWKVSC